MPPAALVSTTARTPSVAQHPHRKGNLLRRVALVGVDPALHHDHRNAAINPATIRPDVALDGRLRKVGDFAVGNNDRLGQRPGDRAQSRAQHNADARLERTQLRPEENRPLQTPDRNNSYVVPTVRLLNSTGEEVKGREKDGRRHMEALAEVLNVCGVELALA